MHICLMNKILKIVQKILAVMNLAIIIDFHEIDINSARETESWIKIPEIENMTL